MNGCISHDDADILTAFADHPMIGRVKYMRVRQDGRIYYRIIPAHDGPNRSLGFGLTDAKHALETIAYWRAKGWAK